MRLLTGDVETPEQARILDLEAEVVSLKDALASAQADVQRERRQTAQAVGSLRRQLTPLYRALQGLFGELDQLHDDAPSQVAANAPDARVAAVWASWKSKMGTASVVIDALLLHGEMNTQQLAIACGKDRTTIPAYIMKLNKAGLINKNGNRFSLKSL